MFVSSGKYILLLLLVIFGCDATGSEASTPLSCTSLRDVSVIAVIARPETYEGRCIRVKGVLFLDDRSGRLFLNKESLSNHVLSNSIMIVIDSASIEKMQELDGLYVSMVGIFKGNAITNVMDVGI